MSRAKPSSSPLPPPHPEPVGWRAGSGLFSCEHPSRMSPYKRGRAPRARSPGNGGTPGRLLFLFLPSRPAARASESEGEIVSKNLKAAGGEAEGGRAAAEGQARAAEALIKSGAAAGRAPIQRADKGRFCGAEPGGSERRGEGEQRRGPRGAPRPPAPRSASAGSACPTRPLRPPCPAN